jgi:hypothetical protein
MSEKGDAETLGNDNGRDKDDIFSLLTFLKHL